jgi:hypothetical protein
VNEHSGTTKVKVFYNNLNDYELHKKNSDP